MTPVFVDTLYWVAVAWPRDPWHSRALAARGKLGSIRMITTEEVLTEFLNAMAGAGPHARRLAADVVGDIQNDDDITVLPQSHDSFVAGLELYEQRPDKGYSLVDCISMAAMRHRGITLALTNDRHFAQEGFSALVER